MFCFIKQHLQNKTFEKCCRKLHMTVQTLLNMLIYGQKSCFLGPTIKELIYPTDRKMYFTFRVLNAHTSKP